MAGFRVHSFRHISSAGRHRYYNESAVGAGWAAAGLDRAELFLQTMFVPEGTPDYRPHHPRAVGLAPPLSELPRERGEPPGAPIALQVHQSIQGSLADLRTEYLDAVVYHNFRAKLQPYPQVLAAWRVLEQYVANGTVRQLGISNCHDLECVSETARKN